MPSDRHEALHLILGFCKDHGLLETYRSLCWEAGMDASTEELAPHVSLLRILLDWKRAFEARFSGTPRIIQPAAQQEESPDTLVLLPRDGVHATVAQVHHLSAPVVLNHQVLTTSASQQASLSQDVGGYGSVQTIALAQPPGSNDTVFRQPAGLHIVGQAGTPHLVLAPSQPHLGAAGEQQQQQQQQLHPRETALHTPQPSLALQPQPSMQARHHELSASGLLLPSGLPPRPHHASLPSHSSSLYSPPDHAGAIQQAPAPAGDESQHASPDEWQQQGGPQDVDEMGGGAAGTAWGTLMSGGGAAAGGQVPLMSRRASSAGSAPPVTKLKKGTEPISQETFLAVVTQVGRGAVASQLFDFRRPQRGSSASARRSAILQLSDAQHDAMYALAGCEDVNFLISNVQSEVRIAMHQVFDIDKESFTVWFKNRGRNPSKMQHHVQSHAVQHHHHLQQQQQQLLQQQQQRMAAANHVLASYASAPVGGGGNGVVVALAVDAGGGAGGFKRSRVSDPAYGHYE